MTAVVLALALAAPAVRDVYGVQVPEGVTTAGRDLKLNSRAQMAQLQQRLDRFAGQIPDLKEGQRLTIVYVPGQGTTVSVGGGEARTVIEGKDFADALFRVWLGDDPVDGDLKDRLLGR